MWSIVGVFEDIYIYIYIYIYDSILIHFLVWSEEDLLIFGALIYTNAL